MPYGTGSDAREATLDALRPLAGLAVPRLVLAVSGGGDSMALLDAAIRLRDACSAFPPFLAVTVDHGLRAASADEARFVARACGEAGVAHRTITLTGAPRTGTAAWARGARMDALRRMARAGIVLVAHTADDRAETVAMRAARRADGPGLAGIAPATLVGDAWFHRPFLHLGREALREAARGTGRGWIDDPSNADEAHERVRVRRRMGASTRERLLALAAASARTREAAARSTAAALRDRLVLDEEPASELARPGPAAAAPLASAHVRDWRGVGASRLPALRALVGRVGGRPYPAAEPALRAAIGTLEGSGRFALGGCLLGMRAGALRVEPEGRGGAVRRLAHPRLVPSFDWPLASLVDPSAPGPPFLADAWGGKPG